MCIFPASPTYGRHRNGCTTSSTWNFISRLMFAPRLNAKCERFYTKSDKFAESLIDFIEIFFSQFGATVPLDLLTRDRH